MDTAHEYFSEIAKETINEANGKATESNRQISKNVEYVMLLCNSILLVHLWNPLLMFDNIDRPEARWRVPQQLRIRRQ